MSWLARVVSVAEVFDALTNTTPYRDRMSPGTALELMLGEMGGQLDTGLIRGLIPTLVDSSASSG